MFVYPYMRQRNAIMEIDPTDHVGSHLGKQNVENPIR